MNEICFNTRELALFMSDFLTSDAGSEISGSTEPYKIEGALEKFISTEWIPEQNNRTK